MAEGYNERSIRELFERGGFDAIAELAMEHPYEAIQAVCAAKEKTDTDLFRCQNFLTEVPDDVDSEGEPVETSPWVSQQDDCRMDLGDEWVKMGRFDIALDIILAGSDKLKRSDELTDLHLKPWVELLASPEFDAQEKLLETLTGLGQVPKVIGPQWGTPAELASHGLGSDGKPGLEDETGPLEESWIETMRQEFIEGGIEGIRPHLAEHPARFFQVLLHTRRPTKQELEAGFVELQRLEVEQGAEHWKIVRIRIAGAHIRQGNLARGLKLLEEVEEIDDDDNDSEMLQALEPLKWTTIVDALRNMALQGSFPEEAIEEIEKLEDPKDDGEMVRILGPERWQKIVTALWAALEQGRLNPDYKDRLQVLDNADG